MSITEMYPAPAVGVALRCQTAAVAEQLALLVAGLDVDGLDGEEAAELTLAFARIERLGAAAKTLAAGQVAQTGYCRRAGFDTAARWLAHATKDNPWEAARAHRDGRPPGRGRAGPDPAGLPVGGADGHPGQRGGHGGHPLAG